MESSPEHRRELLKQGRGHGQEGQEEGVVGKKGVERATSQSSYKQYHPDPFGLSLSLWSCVKVSLPGKE